jgi:hypothetical protein
LDTIFFHFSIYIYIYIYYFLVIISIFLGLKTEAPRIGIEWSKPNKIYCKKLLMNRLVCSLDSKMTPGSAVAFTMLDAINFKAMEKSSIASIRKHNAFPCNLQWTTVLDWKLYLHGMHWH